MTQALRPLLLSLALFAVRIASAQEQPNIVIILADDHNRQTISAYNPGSLIATPGIDRLATEGMRFTRAVVTNSICTPSRATILTGKYSHKTGVKTLNDPIGIQQTFPTLLQAAGYQTALVGKWHLDSEPQGFDYRNVLPSQGVYYNPKFKETGTPWQDGGSGGVTVSGYCTDLISDIAIDWLEGKRNNSNGQPRDPAKPFCLLVHHKAPHGPHDPAARHANLFDGTVFPEPPTLQDDYIGRAPKASEGRLRWSRLLLNVYRQYSADKTYAQSLPRDEGTSHMYQTFMKGYLRLVASLDENVATVLDYLDDPAGDGTGAGFDSDSLTDNTIVIYVSDNGFFNGEHGFYNKMWMYEDSLHVPFLVRYPGAITAGSTNTGFASFLDIAPTLLDYAGAAIPADMQGTSLKATLKDGTTHIRDSIYYHFYKGRSPGIPDIVGIRNDSHKLIHYPGHSGVQWELFDLVNDPKEMTNLLAGIDPQAEYIHDAPLRTLTTALMEDLENRRLQFEDTDAPPVAMYTPPPLGAHQIKQPYAPDSQGTAGTGQTFTSGFDSSPSGSEMPLTDGYESGYGRPSGITGSGDTFAGWTWYTANSTTNTISVPFGGATATVGEQVIRSGRNFEINFTGSTTSKFNFRWGVTDTAIALRRTFPGVPEGWAQVDWQADPMRGFFAYVSQDGGTSWLPIHSGFSFKVVAADLDVVFVGNDGADSSGRENNGLKSVTVSYPAEPGEPYQPNGDISVEALTSEGLERPLRQTVVRITRTGTTSAPRTLNYTVEGTDYPTRTDTVTIPVNASSIDLRIAPIDNAVGKSIQSLSFDLEGAPAPLDLRVTNQPSAQVPYDERVRRCLDLLIEHGTDRYGPVHTPALVSILDVETLECPTDPEKLEEYWRVHRRGRRSPAGSNFMMDQPLLETMRLVSAETGDAKYRDFADSYLGWAMDHQIVTNQADRLGMFWWGWHQYYNVYQDQKRSANGDYHEIHQTHSIDWETMWQIDPSAVQNEIELIWERHVNDKTSGWFSRHDAPAGLDFSMSGASYIQAFAFLHSKLGGTVWLDRAKLLTNRFWIHRNTDTNLFPEAPSASGEFITRWDGYHFTTAAAGLHTHGLLKAYELTGDTDFRDRALAYLKAYATYGYDAGNEAFYGMLKLDGTPVTGTRPAAGYEAYQPRGHLDLWQPYLLGYEMPLYTAMAFSYGYKLTGDPDLLLAARRFATFIENNLPAGPALTTAVYGTYSTNYGTHGAYAMHYAHLVSFFINLYMLTGEQPYLDRAIEQADTAIALLEHKGLFRGHPAKPYYENADGVGFLLYALMQLDAVLEDPAEAVSSRNLQAGNGAEAIPIDFDNW